MRDIKIGMQLKTAFAVLFVFVLVLGVVSFYQTQQVKQQTERMYNHPFTVQRAIGMLRSDILAIHRDMKDHFIATDEKEITLNLGRIEQWKADAFVQIEVIYDRYLGPRSDIDSVKQDFVIWNSMREETIRLLRAGKIEEAASRTKMTGIAGIKVEKILDYIDVIDAFSQNKAIELHQKSEELSQKLALQLIILVAIVLLVALLVNYFLYRNIRKPLEELTRATKRFQKGDFSARSAYSSKNEFGILSDSFNQLADNIQVNLSLNEKIAELSALMMVEENAKIFFPSILSALAKHTGSQMAAVYLLNENKNTYDHFYSIGLDEKARQSFDANSHEGEFGAAIATRKVQLIETITENTPFVFPTVSGTFRPMAIITIPIIAGNEIIAVISLASIAPFSRTTQQLIDKILIALSSRIAGVLATSKIKEFSEKLEVQKNELAKASSYNRSLIEASIDPLVTIGIDGKIMDVNSTTEKITGRSRQELVGTDFSDYFTEPEHAKAGYQQVFREGFVRDYELAIRHSKGEITPVHYNASVYRDEDGKVIGVFAAARDITERKQAEFELNRQNSELETQGLELAKASSYNRSLIEASIDPLVTIGIDGKIMDVNSTTEKITGRSRQELIGTDFSDYFTEPEHAKAGYQQVFREGFVRDYELAIRHSKGEITPVHYNASVYRDEDGKVIGVFAAARDITERKQAEFEMNDLNQALLDKSETLSKANIELEAQKTELSSQSSELIIQNTELEIQKKQLDEASRLKTIFLSNMSHELRTPLNSVIALSGVLNRRLTNKIPEEEHSYLDVIERNGKHLLDLINDILDISRIEAGKEEIEIVQFNVNTAIGEVTSMIHPQAKLKNIELIHTSSNEKVTIASDAGKIRHIIQNLIGNAVKFTEHGVVNIEAKQINEKILITVADTGIGISEKNQHRIFDEFRQADSGTSRKYGGTGLGLAIAKKYANFLGGDISVKSKLGEGSVFTVTLPLEYSSSNTIEPETLLMPFETDKIVSALNEISGVKTILLVEDSEPAIIQIKDILDENKFRVLVTRNGQQAIDIIGETMPDAMILDLMMPGIDGFEVLKTVRENEITSHLPVLILTAKHITKDELRFLKNNNIHQLIQKGNVNRTELLNAVATMVFKPIEVPEQLTRELPNIDGKPLVLVVEDNLDNLLTVKAILADGFYVIEATDGNTGVEMARKHRPDLILMDIQLPGLDGIGAFKLIRNEARLQHIPIIALTASAMTTERESILAHGFDAYIAKPIDEHNFFKTIKEILYGK